ncbi:MAG TPA: MraY family glycosyltransferase [Actinomycetota bacterium]|nr:MraY family glycosyltransferase [Actinomycetota bacterium]
MVRSYLLVFGASAGVTLVATPLVRWVSLRLGWIDHPSDRKVHPRATPTVGGLAIFLGVVAGLVATRFVPFLQDLFQTTSDLDAVAIAGTLIVVLGVMDDTQGVSALGKLTGQVLVAGVVVLLGVQLLFFYFPGQGVLSLSPDLAVPLTILWVVALVNAVNLIDGLDGLAAGIVAIAAAAFFAYMVRSPGGEWNDWEASTAAVLATIAAGAAIGFLPWNFHPARIFMGDSGALVLGLVLAVATISGASRNLEGPTRGDLAVIAVPVLLPVFVLAVPFLDVVLAIFRRMRRGIGISHADKQHIHHRLMDIGHSHRQAVLLMYVWSGLISGCTLVVAFIDGPLRVALIVIGAVIVATVLPFLIRDRAPRGSDRATVVGDGAGAGPGR